VKWIIKDLQNAYQDSTLNAVFMIHSWPWKYAREWKNKNDESKTEKLR